MENRWLLTLLQWFLLIEQEVNLQLIVVGHCLTLTLIPVNVVAKCKEHVNKWPLSYYSR